MPKKQGAPIFQNRTKAKRAFKSGNKRKAAGHFSAYKKAGGKRSYKDVVSGKR